MALVNEGAGGTFFVKLEFVLAEIEVLAGVEHALPGVEHDVAYFQASVHEEVARVHVAVVFDQKVLAALFSQGATGDGIVYDKVENAVKIPDRDGEHIVVIPQIEDFAQEIAPFCAGNGEWFGVGIIVKFHARDKLEEVVFFMGHIPVHLLCTGHIRLIYKHQYVERYLVLLQELDAFKNLGMGCGRVFFSAIRVVQVGGAVKADADQEFIMEKKIGEFVGKQGAVGLQPVADNIAWFCVLSLKGNDLLKKIGS